MSRGITALLICLLALVQAGAQTQTAAPTQTETHTFELLRFDDDHSWLAKAKDRRFYWAIGGDIRQEYSFFDNEDWGSRHIGENNFLLQRYNLQLNVHCSNRLRIFVQARSALEEGRKDGPRFIDQDKLNIQNLFCDLKLWGSRRDSSTLRIGKQEMNYGSARIISVQDGSNARIDFAGLKYIYQKKNFSLDLFAVESDIDHYGVFNNRLSKEINLWGAYFTIHLPGKGHMDLYCIGDRRDSCAYEAGIAHEQRNTVGVRVWKAGRRWSYDLESDYQSGKFGQTDISAWALFIDLSFHFPYLSLTPHLGIKNDYTSGNRYPGKGSLSTFTALYPRSAYFGYNPLVGAGNLVDLHPYIILHPVEKMTINLDVLFNWRYSLNDGIYTPLATYSLKGTPFGKRYVGTSYTLKLEYAITASLMLMAGFQHFETGPFLDRVILNAANARETSVRISFAF